MELSILPRRSVLAQAKPGRGCTSTALLGFGRRSPRSTRICWKALALPIPGLSTATSGLTCPKTRELLWFETPNTYEERWPRVRRIFKPAMCVNLVISPRNLRGAPEELNCEPLCAPWGGKDSGSGLSEIVAWLEFSPERLQGAGFEVLNDVVLNQVLVSFGSAGATRRIIADVQEEGTCWCGQTEWHGRTACGTAFRVGQPRMKMSSTVSRRSSD